MARPAVAPRMPRDRTTIRLRDVTARPRSLRGARPAARAALRHLHRNRVGTLRVRRAQGRQRLAVGALAVAERGSDQVVEERRVLRQQRSVEVRPDRLVALRALRAVVAVVAVGHATVCICPSL